MEYTNTLTKTELELIETIRNAKDPIKAFEIAIGIIADFISEQSA